MGTPARIVLLRHAEKPDAAGDPHLSPRGQTRAAALAQAIPQAFGRPDVLMATAPSADSVRPIETLTPLSVALQLAIKEKWSDKEVQAVAGHVFGTDTYQGELLVICWHHGDLPALARALRADTAPAVWSPEVFDRYWVITFDEEGKVTFADLPQKLLQGDSTH